MKFEACRRSLASVKRLRNNKEVHDDKWNKNYQFLHYILNGVNKGAHNLATGPACLALRSSHTDKPPAMCTHTMCQQDPRTRDQSDHDLSRESAQRLAAEQGPGHGEPGAWRVDLCTGIGMAPHPPYGTYSDKRYPIVALFDEDKIENVEGHSRSASLTCVPWPGRLTGPGDPLLPRRRGRDTATPLRPYALRLSSLGACCASRSRDWDP
jgi:hypothetical protein